MVVSRKTFAHNNPTYFADCKRVDRIYGYSCDCRDLKRDSTIAYTSASAWGRCAVLVARCQSQYFNRTFFGMVAIVIFGENEFGAVGH